MSDSITVSRPYAKAVFSIAKKNGCLDEWNNLLYSLSVIIDDYKIMHFIKNKTISYDSKSAFIIDFLISLKILDDNKNIYVNFINVLSYYNRLLCIKNIYILYKQYMNFELKCIEATVKTACMINSAQKEKIISFLAKKFNKKISASFSVDKDLFGGFLVKIGDSVLDASISGNLFSLRTKIMV